MIADEWGGRGSISPEKTLKALFNNQSGVRERVIMMVGCEFRSMGEHVAKEDSGVKSTEVRGSVKSVRNGDEDVTEIGDGVRGVLKVLAEARGSRKSQLESRESTREQEESGKPWAETESQWMDREGEKRIFWRFQMGLGRRMRGNMM